MEIIKPKKLQKGNTIGLLAISGAVENFNELETAKTRLEQFGYKVLLSETNYKTDRYLCASKEECLKSLYDFFENPDIAAIIASRGGYGTLRLLKDIDYSIIKKNPKIFIGYSDLTNLSSMFYKKAGLVNFYGPMALSDFAGDYDEVSVKKMFEMLSGENKFLKAHDDFNTLVSGVSKGILWGGNLSSLASMCGLDFIPDEDFIFFVEDWHDPVYKLDRMLTQLLNIDKFKQNVKGFIWGEFLGVDDENNFKLLQKELANSLGIPMCDGFKITHGKGKVTLPIGIHSEFNADLGVINFNEEVFSDAS